MLLTLPAVVFLGVFFMVPLAEMVVRSLTDPSPHNYTVFTSSPLYRRVLVNTFWVSGLVTAICLLLGYLYAYVMYIAGTKVRAMLIAFLLLSMWSSLLVRTYAWTVLLQDTGVINDLLGHLGVGPLPLIRNTTGVVIGMSQILLPFMAFPIYASMQRIDSGLLAAATSLEHDRRVLSCAYSSR